MTWMIPRFSAGATPCRKYTAGWKKVDYQMLSQHHGGEIAQIWFTDEYRGPLPITHPCSNRRWTKRILSYAQENESRRAGQARKSLSYSYVNKGRE
jgi:hypothetical protein